jgi:hypothetical protein
MRNLLSVFILISLTIPFSLIAQPKGDQKYRYEQDELGRQYLKRTIELGYDYEINAFIFDLPTTAELTEVFRQDKLNSTVYTREEHLKRSPWKRFVGWFAHLFTPVL